MAGLCRNVFRWEDGASAIFTEYEGSGPMPDALVYENHVAELTGRFAPVPWSRSSDSFMAVQTVDYEWSEFCVVHDIRFREFHSISVYETASDPASFVATLADTNASRTAVSSSDALHPKTKLATLTPGPPVFDLSAPPAPPRSSGLDAVATPSLAQFRASGPANASTADRLAALWSKWGNPNGLAGGSMAATCPFKESEHRMFCILLGCGQPGGPIGVHVISFGMMLPSRLDLSVIMQNGYRLDFPLDAVPDASILHHNKPPANTIDVLLRFLKKDQFARLEYTTQTGKTSHLMVLSGSSQALTRIEQACSNG